MIIYKYNDKKIKASGMGFAFSIMVLIFLDLFIFSLIVGIVYAQEMDKIFVEPTKIEITKSSDDLTFENRTIILGTNGINITNGRMIIGDLSENEHGRWIPRSGIVVEPK